MCGYHKYLKTCLFVPYMILVVSFIALYFLSPLIGPRVLLESVASASIIHKRHVLVPYARDRQALFSILKPLDENRCGWGLVVGLNQFRKL